MRLLKLAPIPMLNDTTPHLDTLSADRGLTLAEMRLIRLLTSNTIHARKCAGSDMLVVELDNAGSLLFVDSTLKGNHREYPVFPQCVRVAQFIDRDGAPIIVSLDADQFGGLYRLEIFKNNLQPVLEYPSRHTLIFFESLEHASRQSA